MINGCNKITNINDDPTFAKLINKEYISVNKTLLFRYLGKDEMRIGIPGQLLPKNEGAIFPIEYGNKKVLRLIPENTIFQITNIVKEYRPMSGTSIWIKAKIKGHGNLENTNVDITMLTDVIYNPKIIDNEYLRELNPESEGEPVNAK